MALPDEEGRPGRGGQWSSTAIANDISVPACGVCGLPDDNLSSLGRCWPCIKAASDAHTAAVQAAWAAQPIRVRRYVEPGEICPDCGKTAGYLHSLRRECKPLALSVSVVRSIRTGSTDKRLTGILRHLRSATEGGRNATLYWCACRVGEMLVRRELPDPHGAACALAMVAAEIGLDGDLGRGEIKGTIESGFRMSGVTV